MNMTAALMLFTLFTVLYNVMIETFTVLFRLTGMTREKARTQVISLLTNSGFTTSESEVIMTGRQRRRLARYTMLSGYSFSVLIISMLVNIFLAMNQTETRKMMVTMIYMIALFVCCFLLMRLSAVRVAFDSFIERLGCRLMYGKKSNIINLIDIFHDKAIAEVIVSRIPEFLDHVCLADCGLKENHGLQLLFMKRDGERLDQINGKTVIREGDSLILFGNYHKIRSIFQFSSFVPEASQGN